ncbi:MAG: hypothetical protein ACD_41C00142G0004 [uncultured bacterium]|nr:MAG: hypothetical protein ACD_41C00142G0004 [uncultured bacterium]
MHDKWSKHAKLAAIINNVLAVFALFLAATMIYLYLK